MYVTGVLERAVNAPLPAWPFLSCSREVLTVERTPDTAYIGMPWQKVLISLRQEVEQGQRLALELFAPSKAYR